MKFKVQYVDLPNGRVYSFIVSGYFWISQFSDRFTPSPQLEIRGPVDFGSTVADGKVLTGYFSIDNYGSKAGEFKIKYTGEEPLTLSPTSGLVQAETSQKIKVILCN